VHLLPPIFIAAVLRRVLDLDTVAHLQNVVAQ